MANSIFWFRQDLRLRDNPALAAAAKRGTLLCLYIDEPKEYGGWKLGEASRSWLAESLEVLQKELESVGGRLVIRHGSSLSVLREAIKKTGAKAVYWNACYEPSLRQRDERVKSSLQKEGTEVQAFDGSLLYPPEIIRDLKGKPYQVFTFFWNASKKYGDPEKPIPAVKKIDGWKGAWKSEEFHSRSVLPDVWEAGEAAAIKRLKVFSSRAREYGQHRDFPSLDGTSLMSPYLHFGEISPRELWHSIRDSDVYLKELMWREFSYHVLIHHPETTDEPLRKKFAHFPWKTNEKRIVAWQEGMTGYPMVDAGMRQLNAVGWMHNRVRMVVASFLVKHLMQHWKVGAKWFWEKLVDADLANNSMGWQWSAGCGADAAPFFRIFNPVEQGKKYDPEGIYIRKYVPEIAHLPDKYLFAPWTAPEEVLRSAGVVLGKTYPKPIVDHTEARAAALKAFHTLYTERD